MNTIKLGDPATQAGIPFTLLMPDSRGGTISIINESSYGLDFTIASSTFRVPADTKRDILVHGQISQQATWQVANNTNAAAAPVSDVVVECYGLDECPASSIQPLMRQTNIGNTVPTTSSSSLINDGNSPGAQLLEATPNDQASSSVELHNDASGFLRVLSANVLRSILNVVRGNATTGKASVQLGDSGDTSITTLYGTLGAGSVVPAATITGVLPESQVGGGYPASAIGAGTLPANVIQTTISSDSAKIISDGSGNMSLQNGTASTPHYQVHDAVNNDTAWMDLTNEFLRIVTIYRGGAGTVPFQIALAAGVCYVSGGQVPGLKSNGGGNPGLTNWVGTADPGVNAVEGDWWAPA